MQYQFIFFCVPNIYEKSERELTGKWLSRQCSLEMLGSEAGEGVAGVDRSLGRERPQWWLVGGEMVTGLRLGPCDDGGLVQEW